MFLSEQISTGFESLKDHPFRTFLTALGIVFGVAAVISMVSIGAGAEKEALDELQRFGINSLRVSTRKLEGEELTEAIKKLARGLSLDDVDFLIESCGFLDAVVPEKLVDGRPYFHGRKFPANIMGVGDRFLEASRFEIEQGRFFDAMDHLKCQPVAVLGHSLYKELFGEYPAIGTIIQIGKVRFRIIGIMREQAKKEGKLAIKSRDHDRDLYIPISTSLERVYKKEEEDRDCYHQISGLWITVKPDSDLLAVKEIVRKILKRRHRGIEDFEILVPLEILQQSQKTQNLFNIVMALIAAISLLVGGIGIMNIMLASVNERTKEIGVRRAVGAAQRDIAVQFLTESIIISFFGGVLGIFFGVFLSYGISFWTGWTTVIPLRSVVLAFFVSTTVGIIFGFFPAIKAAKLDPVTALRHE